MEDTKLVKNCENFYLPCVQTVCPHFIFGVTQRGEAEAHLFLTLSTSRFFVFFFTQFFLPYSFSQKAPNPLSPHVVTSHFFHPTTFSPHFST